MQQKRFAFIILGILLLCYGATAKAADEKNPATYVGKVMIEVTVFFPNEFDQIDEKAKAEIKQLMKQTGAQESGNDLLMPIKPLIGAFVEVGNRRIMIDTNGEFAVPSLLPGTTELPIYQQLSDRVPFAKFPVKKLSHKGEAVDPFIITIRTPYGECHAGKVDHTN